MRHDIARDILATTLVLLAAAAPVAAQGEYIMRADRSAAELTDILVQPPEVQAGGAEARAAAGAVDAVIRADLDYSGLFRLLTRDQVAGKAPGHYRIDGVLEGLPTGGASSPALTLRLLSEPGGQVLLSKRYLPGPDRLRATAHHFVEQVIRMLTDLPGISLTRIVFARGSGDRRDIWCVDYDGEGLLRLTANRTLNLFPSWSPDNKQIAFMSFRQGQQGTYMLEAATGAVRLVGETSGSNLGPSWHPGGQELVVALSKAGQPDIYRLGLEGRVIRRLTVSESIEVSPSWSPGGRDLVFTSDRTGTPQLYVMDGDGTGRRRLTFEGKYNDSAEWSPRGDRIVYACREREITQLMLIEAGGENRRLLTDASWRNCEDPSWAPDGRHVVFASDRTGVFKLYVLDVEDGSIRQLTKGGEPDTTPDWSQ
jgi:TolB protein